VTMFDAGKTRMIGLPYGEKTMTICLAVFIQYQRVMDGQTNKQTDSIAISISHVSVLTCDKNGKNAKKCRDDKAKSNLKTLESNTKLVKIAL